MHAATANKPVQRGIQAYNQLLFNVDVVEQPVIKADFSGRDPQLIEARDTFLLHRYYYYAKLLRKQYADVLHNLGKETFLSKTQVQRIVQNKLEQVLEIKRAAPTAKDLQKMYPYIVW